jgi:hypothetical protein
MLRAGICLLLLASGCAHVNPDEEPVAPLQTPTDPAPGGQDGQGLDFAVRVEGASRCEQAARSLLPASPDQAWRALWSCVCDGHFTALRNLTDGAWDHELQTRHDAPLLVARVIAQRGGDVESDLRLIHDHRVPLFGLHQALARPEQLRGAIVILRGKVSPGGVLDETRLVGLAWDQPLGPSELTLVSGAWPYDSRRLYTQRRGYNLDIATGTRTLAQLNDPFLDADDSVVVLGRFEGLRDGDAWPVVTVLEHFRPSATLAY